MVLVAVGILVGVGDVDGGSVRAGVGDLVGGEFGGDEGDPVDGGDVGDMAGDLADVGVR